MKQTLLLLLVLIYSSVSAQYTVIPDSAFEQTLIHFNIDSDGVINGQVLTSDIENVTELILDGFYSGFVMDISDLTGLEAFTALEKFSVNYTNITELDVSQNLQLKELDCSSNWLMSLDVSSNTLLEVLHIGNTGGDVGPHSEIREIDLSNNPNIHTLYAYDLGIKRINLKNGNNHPNMTLDISTYPWYGSWEDPDYDPNGIYNTICIEVDDVDAALSNQFPYSDWDITHYHAAYIFTDDMVQCSLSTESFSQLNIKIYPNPANGWIYLDSDTSVQIAEIYNLQGQKVLTSNQNQINISDLSSGIYLIKILDSNSKSSIQKIIKK